MSQDIRAMIRKKYGGAIKNKTSCCSINGCCNSSSDNDANIISANLYDSNQKNLLPVEFFAGTFGCGNPTALAELFPGETVLDLGSGSGIDVLLSAKRVGPHGKAYGLDMTDEMLEEAKKKQRQAGIENVEFLKGYIEDIPLKDKSVDVIISNCVINLSTDKKKVLKESYRVLRDGGRFAISDIVLKRPLPPKVQQDVMAWAGCVAGALLIDEYTSLLEEVGFEDIDIEITREYDLTSSLAEGLLPDLSSEEREVYKDTVASAFLRAEKPKK